jgi:hypothetical protein
MNCVKFLSTRVLTPTIAALAMFFLAACAAVSESLSSVAVDSQLDALYTVKAAGERSVVRAITRNTKCPRIDWLGAPHELMHVRVEPALVPLRGDSAQADAKPARFDELVCEAEWPPMATSGTVENRTLLAPKRDLHRIILIADTGCRMKASENAFQACNDETLWPFAQIAKNAAALKPDLVVHIGDIHYRESPCPAAHKGCAQSAWGYGSDAWRADFFAPAAPLLSAAPWVFVRGNHESCFRAGQGWFRFVDSVPFTTERSCDRVVNDAGADFTEPYAVALGGGAQFVVFDSSKSSGKPYAITDLAFNKYAQHIEQVGTLATQAKHSFFLSHHPLFAFAPITKKNATETAKPGGSGGLQSAFASRYAERLFPDAVSVVMHGHVHLFEAMSFSTNHPASLIFGNSGSANEGRAPASVANDAEVYPEARVDDYAAQSEFGFAMLERVSPSDATQWKLTEYDVLGRAKIVCEIIGSKSRCNTTKSQQQ